MKFTIFATILVALLATAFADECDPSKINYKVFKDAKCTTLAVKKTAKFGKPKVADYGKWKQGCQTIKVKGVPLSYKLNCNANGIHQRIFNGPGCKTEVKKIDFKWNKCLSNQFKGKTIYFIASTRESLTVPA